jgi:hypothetical protein
MSSVSVLCGDDAEDAGDDEAGEAFGMRADEK